MNLSQFEDKYPDSNWLESRSGADRYSNGLAEGSADESVWFCSNCEEAIDSPEEGCECEGNH